MTTVAFVSKDYDLRGNGADVIEGAQIFRGCFYALLKMDVKIILKRNCLWAYLWAIKEAAAARKRLKI